MAKAFGTRPSHLLRIEDVWAAYQLDSAASHFGNYVEAKLQEYDTESKRPVYSLDELLKPPTPLDEQGFDDEDMGDILDVLGPLLGKSGVALVEAST